MGAHAIDPSAPEAEADGTLSAPGQTLCLKKKKNIFLKSILHIKFNHNKNSIYRSYQACHSVLNKNLYKSYESTK